ncbi:MAG: tetratricopeptide repeat protein [Planctomycetota bacterium]|jgi:serine/threonine protein kinase/tetratricopeptide (TPR) repeat protein
MSDERQAKAIFQRAIERPPTDRTAFLDEACTDPALRHRVDKLLDAYEDLDDFLAEPTNGATEPSEGPGTVIGPYKLLQEIGEGGFGVVYMAEQSEPVRRKVALKVVKLGMDTKQVIARFEAERQALAVMDHPHIAKVLDAGETESGRPYFVMELVKGIPITDYCDQAQLDTRSRLELFQRVCEAVQHAHNKGIIHRDIKPSNVMVTLHDGEPVPKVIDFGIAKAVDRPLTDKTLFTEFRQMIGTPEYMAPEQAEMSGLDVDTRADVYSLGVLLYELLTGSKPFDLKELVQQGYEEVLRTIREVDPPKPSTRLSTMGEEVDTVAKQRHTQPRLLGRIVRGDLDWIVMKALEKDRSRRYETANGFAKDIGRFLTNEPVRAMPPSTRYRLRKYLVRHRVGTIAGIVIVGALLVSGGLAYAGMGEADREAEAEELAAADATRKAATARQAKAAEAEQRERAEAGTAKAETEKARAETVLEFIHSILSSADPDEVNGRNYTVRQLLDDFDRELGTQLKDQPEVEAMIRQTMGNSYRALGLYDKARPHLEEALAFRRRSGEEDARLADSINDWALLIEVIGNYGEAEKLHREALAIRRTALGDEHPGVAISLNNLASVLWVKGDFDAAERLCREALAVWRKASGDEHPDEATTFSNNLASVLLDKGDLDVAEKLIRQTLAIYRRSLGEEHPTVATSLNNLATVLLRKRDLDAAEKLHRNALAIRRKALGDEHPKVATSFNNLGHVLHLKGNNDEAENLIRRALAIYRKSFGEEHPKVAVSLTNLAAVLLSKGDLDAAERPFREALAIRRKALGDKHPLVTESLSNLAFVLLAKPDYPAIEAVAHRLLERERSDRWLAVLGLCLLKQNKYAEAEPITRECLAIRAKKIPGHWLHYNTMSMLGGALAGQGKHAEAEPLLVDGYAKMQPPKRNAIRKREALERVIKLYETWGKPDEAAKWMAQRGTSR